MRNRSYPPCLQLARFPPPDACHGEHLVRELNSSPATGPGGTIVTRKPMMDSAAMVIRGLDELRLTAPCRHHDTKLGGADGATP